LTVTQRRPLVRVVVARPEAAGYRTSLWTCRRIVEVIRQRFKVTYHADHVGRLLRACGFNPQRPQPQPKQREDRHVRAWIQQEWPRVKKLARRRAHLICLHETGFMMLPVLRRTWARAPCGLTPLLAVHARSRERAPGWRRSSCRPAAVSSSSRCPAPASRERAPGCRQPCHDSPAKVTQRCGSREASNERATWKRRPPPHSRRRTPDPRTPAAPAATGWTPNS
jgi:Winged helix-turn helix